MNAGSLLPLVVAVLAVTGCAEMRWSKPGVDSARLDEDLAQCRGEARLQAAREATPRVPGSSRAVAMDSMGRPVAAPPMARATDPLLLEQDLTGACMRGKGYELAPLERRDK